MDMKIVLASDPFAYDLKRALAVHLEKSGHSVVDADSYSNASFYIAAADGAKRIVSGAGDCGIFLCGTGAGMNVVANKIPGITAVAVESTFTAAKAKIINNANVITMGAMVVGKELACAMADAWLKAEFAEGLDVQTADFLRDAEKFIAGLEK